MLRIQEQAERKWREFGEACSQAGLSLPCDSRFEEACKKVFVSSRFVLNACMKDPVLIIQLYESGRLTRTTTEKTLAKLVQEAAGKSSSLEELSVRLRGLRRQEMVRIAWRDIAQQADLKETMQDLSTLAEACLSEALLNLFRWMTQDFGTPKLSDLETPGLIVLGMGKLGARELNFSSDIDLIFAHPGPGSTTGGPRSLSHDEFFTLLARRLINTIGALTPDGMVFRVDTRLRPFGEGGPLVISTEAMEGYYEDFGRDWERYALVKARPVAGNIPGGQRLLETLRPFVYRRYLDYQVFDSLRSMKAMIKAEIARKGLRDHIKLGPGGIREVEFICQVFQLLRGGRIPELQEPSTLRTLELLALHALLPEEVCQDLYDAYCFLRTVEHRLQEYDDQQTHELPHSPLEQEQLAFSMGYESYRSFAASLDRHRNTVHGHFKDLLAPERVQRKEGQEDPFVSVWKGCEDESRRADLLRSLGFQDPEGTSRLMEALSRSKTAMASRGLERLDLLVPLLLKESAGTPNPDRAFSRVVKVIESIGRRPVYLSLLIENPKAVSQLVALCSKSTWITEMLARHPILMDELLDPQALYSPLEKEDLRRELLGLLGRIPPDDLELIMDEMRRFRQANVLRVAAADLTGALGVKEVGPRLTNIAEVVLEEVLRRSWDHLSTRHGVPELGFSGDHDRPCGIAIVGYGKLGGMEMGYNSDLDLVFLHAASPGILTTGPRRIDATLFYSRIGQRMIHMLTAHTPAGILYPVDMRLRPNGASGVLVTSLEGFFQYQISEAWTWEHQALVRARTVCGDPELAARFRDSRRKVLQKKRDPQDLKRAIGEMRDRIIKEAGERDTDLFDIKRHPGGLVDIEFLIQFTVLAWAHSHPQITEHTNALNLLGTFKDLGLMDPEETAVLEEAYIIYMSFINRLGLDGKPALTSDSKLRSVQQKVLDIWAKNMRSTVK